MVCPYNGIVFSLEKQKGMQTQATAQMSLEDIRLSAINQLQKDKFHDSLRHLQHQDSQRKETEWLDVKKESNSSRRKEGSVC